MFAVDGSRGAPPHTDRRPTSRGPGRGRDVDCLLTFRSSPPSPTCGRSNRGRLQRARPTPATSSIRSSAATGSCSTNNATWPPCTRTTTTTARPPAASAASSRATSSSTSTKVDWAKLGPETQLLRIYSGGYRSTVWRRDLEAAGIPAQTPDGKTTWHSLRVRYINRLIESGSDLKTLQELARHSTAQLSLEVYGKRDPDRLRAAIEEVTNRLHAGTAKPARHGAKRVSEHRSDWIRTNDLLTPSQTRYQATLHSGSDPRRIAPARESASPFPAYDVIHMTASIRLCMTAPQARQHSGRQPDLRGAAHLLPAPAMPSPF